VNTGAGEAGRPATATVLFTDLVGSTELRRAVGDDTADDIRRSHDHPPEAPLRARIRTYGSASIRTHERVHAWAAPARSPTKMGLLRRHR
jgi:hypothetical protein